MSFLLKKYLSEDNRHRFASKGTGEPPVRSESEPCCELCLLDSLE